MPRLRRVPPRMAAKLRRRAPRHPPGPEAALRRAIARVGLLLSRDLRARLRLVALHTLAQRRDARATPSRKSALDASRAYGRRLVRAAPFRRAISQAAHRAAATTARQVHAALGEHAPDEPADLGRYADELASQIRANAEQMVDDAVDRAGDVLDEWLALDPDRSERAGDVDALDDMLDEDQDRNTGRALAQAALAFGVFFALFNRTAQEDAGVGRYVWLSQKDSRVRLEHAELDEAIADWDDPPLTSDKSDNEEDDHPGEDYNCRCVASPLTPEDEAELGLD